LEKGASLALQTELIGRDKAWYRSISDRRATAWILRPFHSRKDGSHSYMSKIAYFRQFRIEVFDFEFDCPKCGLLMDRKADHAMVCKNGGLNHHRHHVFQQHLLHALRDGGLVTETEKDLSSMLKDVDVNKLRLRPADFWIPHGCSWNRYQPLLIDLGFVTAIQKTFLENACNEKGFAAKKVEERKHKKYDTYLEKMNFNFLVLAVEVTGRWGYESLEFVQHVIGLVATNLREPYSVIAADFWQRFALLLQETNAEAIMKRSPIIYYPIYSPMQTKTMH